MDRSQALSKLFSVLIIFTISIFYGLHDDLAWAHKKIESGAVSSSSNRGPFSLVDHTGRAVTNEDFLGQFMLVYFGYTHCPDVCPIDLRVMIAAIKILGGDGKKIQPIFITVDPERDTVDVMASYVTRLHPRLLGLTGTPDQVAAAAQVYHIRRMKFFPLVNEDDRQNEVNANNAHYVVDHTAAIILVGPDGSGLSGFPHGITPEAIAADIKRFINQ